MSLEQNGEADEADGVFTNVASARRKKQSQQSVESKGAGLQWES